MLAIIFDSVGAGEWLVLLAVLLVVMGPKRLPSTASKIGAYYSKFRRAAESFKRQIMEMDYEMEREIAKAEREVEESMRVDESAGPTPSAEAMEGHENQDDSGPVMEEPTAPVEENGDKPD